jgi:putative endonuclease
MKLLYVYIVKCSDGSYYTGVTSDIDRRLAEHNEGNDVKAYTYKRRPVTLVYLESFQEHLQAIDWEKQIKGWNRKKKEALINDEWDKIVEYSNQKNWEKLARK